MGRLPTENDITAILVDGRNPRSVYAAGSGGVFHSTDAGRGWKMVGGLPKKAWVALAQDPRRPENVFALAADDTLLKSLDGGETWHQVR
ncbi:MAG: WD40/YVTN/BNR-like repeat-containing protein [bacterium]